MEVSITAMSGEKIINEFNRRDTEIAEKKENSESCKSCLSMLNNFFDGLNQSFARQRGMAMITVLGVTALLALVVTGAFTILMQRELGSSGAFELNFAQYYLKDISSQTTGKFNVLVQSKFADGTIFDEATLQALRNGLPTDGLFQMDDLAYDASIAFSLPNGSFTPSNYSAPLVTITNSGHPLEGVQARRYVVRMVAALTPKYSLVSGFTNSTISVTNDLVYYDVPVSSMALGTSTNLAMDSTCPLVITGATCFARNLSADASSLSVVGQVMGAGTFSSSQTFNLNNGSFAKSDTATDWRYQTEVLGQRLISGANPMNLGFDFSRMSGAEIFETGSISDTTAERAKKMYYAADYRVNVQVQGTNITAYTVRDSGDSVVSNAFTSNLRTGFYVYTNYGPSLVVWNVSSAPKTFNTIFFEVNDAGGTRSNVGFGLDSCKDLSGFVNGSVTGLTVVTPNILVQLDHFNTTNSVPAMLVTPEYYRGIP